MSRSTVLMALFVGLAVGCGGIDNAGGSSNDESKRQCGGIAGLACASDEVCDYEDKTCSTRDLAGTCVDRPIACDLIQDLVCGCDLITYENNCERLRAGITLAHDGDCDRAASCGRARCPSGQTCCNPLLGICTVPGTPCVL